MSVVHWLHDGVPDAVHSRMQAALDIAKPIERVESDLVAQAFLTEEMSGIAPLRMQKFSMLSTTPQALVCPGQTRWRACVVF